MAFSRIEDEQGRGPSPLFSLPEPGGETSLIGEMVIINITLVSRPLALLQIPPWPYPHQGFFMSEENIGAHGEKVNRDCSGSHENLEFRFHFDLFYQYSTSFIFLCCHPCFSIFRYQMVNIYVHLSHSSLL